MKWEPLAAMLAVLALGLWLVAGRTDRLAGIEIRPGAVTQRVLIANQRGVLESVTSESGETTFRLLLRSGYTSDVMSSAETERWLGPDLVRDAARSGDAWLFRLLNITSFTSLTWVALGFVGQAAFAGRTLIQWVISEKNRRSTVPVLFWWLSLGGGVMLFAYFAWRQDIVGVLGQSTGLVVYARNLKLIAKQRRREARAANSTPVDSIPTAS